ncbi:hypothetical protein JXB31_01470 [Candidatus Woesearchaeota archaeon]|nr:hypothetical protein [Candidatus Woesearchaeota archaeon]
MLGILIYGVLFVVAIILLWKLLKSIVRVALVAVMIVLITGSITAFFVYKDISDFSHKFSEEPNLFMVAEDGNIVFAAGINTAAGVITTAGTNTGYATSSDESLTGQKGSFGEDSIGNPSGDPISNPSGNPADISTDNPIKVFGRTETEAISNSYMMHDMERIRGTNYKVIVFDMQMLRETLPDPVELPEGMLSPEEPGEEAALGSVPGIRMPKSIPRDKILDMLSSDMPQEIFIEHMCTGMDDAVKPYVRDSLMQSEAFSNQEKTKGIAFGIVINEIMDKQGLGCIFGGLKNDSVTIYPETISIRLLKAMPAGFLDRYIS